MLWEEYSRSLATLNSMPNIRDYSNIHDITTDLTEPRLQIINNESSNVPTLETIGGKEQNNNNTNNQISSQTHSEQNLPLPNNSQNELSNNSITNDSNPPNYTINQPTQPLSTSESTYSDSESSPKLASLLNASRNNQNDQI